MPPLQIFLNFLNAFSTLLTFILPYNRVFYFAELFSKHQICENIYQVDSHILVCCSYTNNDLLKSASEIQVSSLALCVQKKCFSKNKIQMRMTSHCFFSCSICRSYNTEHGCLCNSSVNATLAGQQRPTPTGGSGKIQLKQVGNDIKTYPKSKVNRIASTVFRKYQLSF